MISFSHINYVFFVSKEIGTMCRASCTFNLLIQIISIDSFEAYLSMFILETYFRSSVG